MVIVLLVLVIEVAMLRTLPEVVDGVDFGDNVAGGG